MDLKPDTTSVEPSTIDGIQSMAVVINGTREFVHSFDVMQEADPVSVLAAAAERIKECYPTTGRAFTQRVFEVYRMPDATSMSELVMAREQGESIGIVEFDPYDGSTDFSLGVDKGLSSPGPFEHQVLLAETLDVSEAHNWATSEVVENLGRLENAAQWLLDNSLPSEIGNEVHGSRDAMIRERLYRETRVEMNLCARLRCLCGLLIIRGRPELATPNQLFWASREIDPDDHPDLPHWLLCNWKDFDRAVLHQFEGIATRSTALRTIDARW